MMKSRYILFTLACVIAACNSRDRYIDQIKDKYDYTVDGYVPDEKTATKVAEAILLPIYGESVLQQRPYIAELQGDTVWVIEGTLAPGYDGGTAHIEIRKKDCTVLKLTHGK